MLRPSSLPGEERSAPAGGCFNYLPLRTWEKDGIVQFDGVVEIRKYLEISAKTPPNRMISGKKIFATQQDLPRASGGAQKCRAAFERSWKRAAYHRSPASRFSRCPASTGRRIASSSRRARRVSVATSSEMSSSGTVSPGVRLLSIASRNAPSAWPGKRLRRSSRPLPCLFRKSLVSLSAVHFGTPVRESTWNTCCLPILGLLANRLRQVPQNMSCRLQDRCGRFAAVCRCCVFRTTDMANVRGCSVPPFRTLPETS